MNGIKKVTALIGSAIVLTLLAAGPASALSERSPSQTFVLYGAGSTFDHPISPVPRPDLREGLVRDRG